jgi:hypothetical protein
MGSASNWPASGPLRRVAGLLTLAAGVVCAAPGPMAATDNPFPTLVGSWSGTGEARLDGGKTESMRCKGYYTSQGNDGLGVAIRCANASSKIDLRATLSYSGGNVSGNWEERTYNAAGSVSGKASANKLNLAITGGGLTASMAVSINGSSHSVAISTEGTGLKGVNISLSRG